MNRYVLDPSHIAPSRTDANSNGHFPVNNQAQTGTPRGFKLNNMGVNFAQMGGNMHNAMQIAAIMREMNTQHGPVGGLNTFPGGVEDDKHGVGPMRRGGYRNTPRVLGPYDRQPKDNRNARWNGGAGRLTPPRNMSGSMRAAGGGLGRFADGSVAGSVGPKDAVQGRSLKSYEDLDAAGGAESSALDY